MRTPRLLLLPLAVTTAGTIVALASAQLPALPGDAPPSTNSSGTVAPTVTATGTVTAAPPPTTTATPSAPPVPTPMMTATAKPTPEPSEEAAAAPKEEKSDHSMVVGRVGIGYFGQYDVPIGVPPNRNPTTEAVQLVGFRWWINEKAGLDFALGWNLQSGTNTAANVSSDQPSTLALALRLAVPIAVYSASHYTFLLAPEIAYGHAGETIAGTRTAFGQGPDTKHSGDRFGIGGRAGAEIHFGFIGMPRLSLQATVGLSLELTRGDSTVANAGAVPGTTELSYSHTGFSTFTGHQPWNIFISNVAAVYYF